MDVVKNLIEHGADINIKGKNQWTPLHLATQEGNCLNQRPSAVLNQTQLTQPVPRQCFLVPFENR